MREGRGAVIAGGGTGGHVVPSLQIARALVDRGHAPRDIELFGSRRGQEASLWPTLDFPYRLLAGRGIRRSIRPEAVWANAGAVLGLMWATAGALASFARRRPRVVVVVGGYASFPAGCAAVLTRVPMVLVTTDAVPGAVNAMLGRFAVVNAVAFPGTRLPRAQVTGTPVRPELSSLPSREASREALALPSHRQTVAATGGSLGAHTINRSVSELAALWTDRDERSIYHVSGRREYEAFAAAESDGGGAAGLYYRVVPFEERMTEFYGAADVCVCRAGAMTVAELTVSGVPAILVPLPGAPRDHQTHNARSLADAGAAVLIPDAECDGKRLADELDALLSDPGRLSAMGAAARRLGHPDAAAKVAELVDAHAR